jgi:Protein phosphatase 2C
MIVADGAGTAHRSGLLAELMVESFIGTAGDAPPLAPLDNASYRRWQEDVSMRWRRLAEEETGSEWYERKNLERGSAAAFAAAVITDQSCWCVAVGDCCLFQIRPGPPPTCVASFPIRTWAAFNSTPALLRTDLRLPTIWPQWTRLQVNPGDTLLGGSDGIAEWILAAAVQNPEVWQLLIEMGAGDFLTLVDKEREVGTMVDDDTIVVRLTLGSDK